MKELQIVNGLAVVTSLQISESFGKQHKHVLEAIEKLVAENSATKSMLIEDTYKNRGKDYKMYYLTRDGFTLLAMGFNGKKALAFKLSYIEAFNKMEEYIKNQQIRLPQNYKEALLQLVEQVELNEKAALKIEQQAQVIVTMEPKAKYFDDLVDSKTLTNFRDTAKMLKIQQSEFINYLLENKYLYRDGKQKLKPYAEYTNNLFEIKEKHNHKNKWSGPQTMITHRGRETFNLLINGNNKEI